MAISEVATAVRTLTTEQIEQRLAELREEEQGLKVLLRSVTARERARRQHQRDRKEARHDR